MNEHDMQMPEEVEADARDSIGRLLGSLRSLQERVDAVAPVAGGMLARENARTAYEPIALQTHQLCSSGIEPLQTTAMILEHHGLPMLSLYPLIRASLEATAYAIWLQSPGTSKKRVLRSLMLTKKHREDADATTSVIAPIDPANTERFLNRLNELKAMTPGLEQVSLDRGFPNTTDVLLDVDRTITTSPYSLVTSWRICSGLAHSNIAMHHRILERRQETDYVDGVAQFHMTSSFAVVERLLRPSVQALREAVALLERRASER